MEFKIKTSLLQSLVSTVIKGSDNKLKGIGAGAIMMIEVQKGTLSLLTSDSVTYLKVMQEGINGTDFCAAVEPVLFSKIVAKLSAEETTLKQIYNKSNKLTGISIQSGSGQFKIPVELDFNTDEMTYLKFPSIISDNPEIIHLSSIKKILQTNKPAIPELIMSPDSVCYSGYYCDTDVTTTDGLSKIAITQIKLFNEPTLLTSRCIDLLGLMTEEQIKVHRKDDCICFETSNMMISTREISQKKSFLVDRCRNYLSNNLGHTCSVKKSDILSVLDRIALFVSPKDNDLILMSFKQNGIYLSTIGLTGQETVSYINSTNWEDLMVCPNLTMLKSFISNQLGDTVTFEYGSVESLKFIGDNYSQIISLSKEQVSKQNESDVDLDSSVDTVDYDEIEEFSGVI